MAKNNSNTMRPLSYNNYSSSANHLKFIISIVAIVLSSGILFSHASSRLYPALPISLFLALLFLLLGLTMIDIRKYTNIYLGVVVSVGITYTTYIFLFPASPIGMDPNTLAVDIHQVKIIGDLSVIDSRFYRNAPLYFILPAVAGIITDLPVIHAMIIYPIILSVVLPLSSSILALNANRNSQSVVAIIAALLTLAATLSLKFSYWPIPQSLAIVLLCVLIILLLKNYYGIRGEIAFLEIVVLFGLLFTHKLPLVLLLTFFSALISLALVEHKFSQEIWNFTSLSRVTIFTILALTIFAVWILVTGVFTNSIFQLVGVVIFTIGILGLYEEGWQSGPSYYQQVPLPSLPHLKSLTIFTGALLVVQMVFLTDLAERLIARVLTFLDGGLGVPSSTNKAVEAAASPEFPLFGMFFHYSNALILLLLGGIAWLYLASSRKRNAAVQILLAIVAVTVFFSGTTVINPSAASPFRFLLIAEPWIAAVLAVTFGSFFMKKHLRSVSLSVVFVLIIILAFQTLAFAAVPDYTASPRYYLTEGETEAKSFGFQSIPDDISTDPYLITAASPLEMRPPADQDAEQYESAEEGLLLGNISDRDSDYFAYRHVQVYRMSGWWQLTWNPQSDLERTEHRIYDNEDVQFYKKP